MGINFADRLRQLHGVKCMSVDGVEYEVPPTDSIYAVETAISFSDGTRLAAQFWRLIKSGTPLVSIFDHRQKCGLAVPLDAIHVLKNELQSNVILAAEMNETTGDLHFSFERDIKLEVFNFTAFEIWDITFADGTREFSNYALQK